MEQVLGRVHRVGQEADTITVRTVLTLGIDKTMARDCIRDTICSAETMGGLRKLLVASYDPPLFFNEAMEQYHNE